jgi:hypothetical protein
VVIVDEQRGSEALHGGERDPETSTALLVRSGSDAEAAVIRQLLDSYGIACRVVSDVSQTLFPLWLDGLREIRIFVPPSRLSEAQRLLAEHRREGLRSIRGGKLAAGEHRDPE